MRVNISLEQRDSCSVLTKAYVGKTPSERQVKHCKYILTQHVNTPAPGFFCKIFPSSVIEN